MKKLMVVAMIAGSMMMAAEVTGAEATTKATPMASASAPAAATKPARRQLTPDQRAAMRAKFEQRMASRKAEMEKKAIEIIKKYGLDDEKAKALLAELETTLKMSRRPRPNAKRQVPDPVPAKAE